MNSTSDDIKEKFNELIGLFKNQKIMCSGLYSNLEILDFDVPQIQISGSDITKIESVIIRENSWKLLSFYPKSKFYCFEEIVLKSIELEEGILPKLNDVEKIERFFFYNEQDFIVTVQSIK